MRFQVALLAAVGLGLALCAFTAAPVQQGQPGAPIVVSKYETKVPQGIPAVFEGNTVVVEKARTLQVKVTRPDKSVETLSVTADLTGKFNFSYKKTDQEGHYTVDVFPAGGKGEPVTFKFEVVDVSDAAEAPAQRLQEVQQTSERLLAAVEAAIRKAPADSSQTEALNRLGQIRDRIQRQARVVADARAAMGHLPAISTANAQAASETGRALADLNLWATDCQETLQQAADKEAQIRSSASLCDTLNLAAEGLSLLSSVMNFVGGPVTIVKNLIVDKLVPAGIGATAGSDNAKFGLTEGFKVASTAAEGYVAIAAGTPGLIGDTAQFVVGKFFSAYCTVLSGPVKATFSVTVKEKGSAWWKYDVELNGKLTMWADKKAAADPQGVSYHGRLEGNATKVNFWEDVFILSPLPRGTAVLLRKRITPVTLGNTSNDPLGFGSAVHAISPGYFNLEYHGWLNSERLLLKKPRKIIDFSPLFQNQLAVAMVNPGIPVPYFEKFEFPIQKAEWIIDRSVDGDDVVIPASEDGGKVKVKKSFPRTSVNGEVSGQFLLNFDLTGDKG